jgi:8-oxo-dGTP diphosphatase
MIDKMFVATKAFIMCDGKVLLLRESSDYKDSAHTGKLDLPGGRVELGQKFDESLLREVQEETGLDVEIGKSFFVNESYPIVRGENWQIIRIFFECHSKSKDVKLSEDHSEFIWIKPKEYPQYNVIENLIPVFEEFLAQ